LRISLKKEGVDQKCLENLPSPESKEVASRLGTPHHSKAKVACYVIRALSGVASNHSYRCSVSVKAQS
jgi:hypothetical protein